MPISIELTRDEHGELIVRSIGLDWFESRAHFIDSKTGLRVTKIKPQYLMLYYLENATLDFPPIPIYSPPLPPTHLPPIGETTTTEKEQVTNDERERRTEEIWNADLVRHGK